MEDGRTAKLTDTVCAQGPKGRERTQDLGITDSKCPVSIRGPGNLTLLFG